MKKVKYVFLVLSFMFLFTGCVSKKEDESPKKIEEIVDETLVTINGLEFHLDKNTSYEEITYNTVGDFQEVVQTNYVQYRYTQEDGTNLLFFRIFAYKGKDIDAARNDLGIDSNLQYQNGKTDSIEYQFIENPRDDGVIHFYFIHKNNDTYVLNFVSKYDIKDFEEKVVNSVKF